MKWYAVVNGKEGNKIYKDWNTCERNVKGISGAKFKKFNNENDAKKFIENGSRVDDREPSVIAYVDGSFNESTNSYGYGLVIVAGDVVLHTAKGSGCNPEITSQRNVAGEIFGALHAVKYAKDNQIPELTIAYDYKGIECWVTKEWRANTPLTKAYGEAINIEMSKNLYIKFKKVKAHSGNKFNEQADYLAKQAVGIA